MSVFRNRAALLIATTAALAAVALPASAAQAAPSQPVPVSSSAAHQPAGEVGAMGAKVDVASAALDITNKIINIVNDAIERGQNRSGYVKSLMEGSFYESGQRYNVMVINDQIEYYGELHNIVYDAKVSGIHGRYRVLVFDSGQFWNKGDGGWINWAFRGVFDRDGGHVTFRKFS
ncbi:stress protein [Streptomyces sp. NPDC048606]|uniref:stress protein n=1 Tax=Streptomyces sp. NPDC048606 TaxID=3154726 RepID=UPI003449B816